jgi:hypothetical protein
MGAVIFSTNIKEMKRLHTRPLVVPLRCLPGAAVFRYIGATELTVTLVLALRGSLSRTLCSVIILSAVGLLIARDRRHRGGSVVERGELRSPVWPEVSREHPVHAAGRQRRRGFLQPGQGGTVRLGEFGRERCLEDRQRLAELHRAALELPKDPEHLVGGALLDLPGDKLRGPAADALPEAERGPAREPERQPGQLHGPVDSVAGNVIHTLILRQLKNFYSERTRGNPQIPLFPRDAAHTPARPRPGPVLSY